MQPKAKGGKGRAGFPRNGTVDATDHNNPVGYCRVKLEDKGGILTQPLPVLFGFTGQHKVFAMPQPGDPVLVLMDENSEEGWIIGARYTKQTQPPVESAEKYHIRFGEDTFLELDTSNSTLTIDTQGPIVVNALKDVTVETQETITVTSAKQIDVTATTGNITIAAATGDVVLGAATGNVTMNSSGNTAVSSTGTLTIDAQDTATITAPRIDLNPDSDQVFIEGRRAAKVGDSTTDGATII